MAHVPPEEPAGASAEVQGRDRADAHVGEQPQPGERYGPLRVVRTQKDDGRTLTYYYDARATGTAHE